MTTSQQSCENLLAAISPDDQARLLCHFGHQLTVMARFAYEFQGPGVTDPRLLRDLNEIQHRVFGQLASLVAGKQPEFSPDSLAAWLLGEDKPHLHEQLAATFARAVERAQLVA